MFDCNEESDVPIPNSVPAPNAPKSPPAVAGCVAVGPAAPNPAVGPAAPNPAVGPAAPNPAVGPAAPNPAVGPNAADAADCIGWICQSQRHSGTAAHTPERTKITRESQHNATNGS